MTPTQKGSFQLFRFAGINVFVHWSWFIVAVVLIEMQRDSYPSIVWNVLTFLGLFTIVLLHEFGHALACKQTGGRVDQIVLWFLGGVAYVDSQRPGATLWSLVAGPLVNVILAPVLGGFLLLGGALNWDHAYPNVFVLISSLFQIDLVLLVFNLLPVYPLDGGQILRTLLWFPLGKARSLLVSTFIGFFGVAAIGCVALYYLITERAYWMCIMTCFLAMNCWQDFQYARALTRLSKLPRYANFNCPSCKTAPPIGAFWHCGACRQPFDLFATAGSCPNCATFFNVGRCLDCGGMRPINEWVSHIDV